MEHVIKRQTISLRLPSESRSHAFQVQHDISAHYWREVLKVIERVFDESSTEEEVIRIDRLEIDLGDVTEEVLSDDTLSEVLLTTIEDQLREKLRASSSIPKSAVQRSVSNYEQWLFYMKHGYLPWSAVHINEKWYEDILITLATDHNCMSSLKEQLNNDRFLVERITQQHPESFLIRLAGILAAQRMDDLGGVLDDWIKGMPTARVHSLEFNIRKSGWQRILELMSGMSEKVSIAVIKQALADQTGTAKQNDIEQGGTASKTDDTIFVQQAGVVLLHPFLNTFFRRLLLVENGMFLSQEAKQKALYLIHYMATGILDGEEHELVVPKVLCAYPLHAPITRGVQITVAEKEEADHLLEELILQWSVLKNTTPAALRQEFLKREGKLSEKNGQRLLHMESSAADVLLDNLPWNLSMIKLPWMKELLRVEWR